MINKVNLTLQSQLHFVQEKKTQTLLNTWNYASNKTQLLPFLTRDEQTIFNY